MLNPFKGSAQITKGSVRKALFFKSKKHTSGIVPQAYILDTIVYNTISIPRPHPQPCKLRWGIHLAMLTALRSGSSDCALDLDSGEQWFGVPRSTTRKRWGSHPPRGIAIPIVIVIRMLCTDVPCRLWRCFMETKDISPSICRLHFYRRALTFGFGLDFNTLISLCLLEFCFTL